MDRLFDQVKYLAKTKFQTLDDLQERQGEIKDRMDELKQERKELYNAHKRALRKEDPYEVEEIEKRQTAVSQELKDLRKEMAMCYAIAERSGEGKLNQIRKEQIDHEPRRRCGRTNRADEPQWS
jgi:predicted nuclease with TOPRIM domain